MSDEQVPTVACHATPQEVYAAMASVYQAEIGEPPTRTSLLSLMAQWSLETGNGAACMNWNPAGIKWTGPGDGHDYATYLTHETMGNHDEVLPQHFRAYATLEAGISDYLHVLRNRYGFAWPAIESGDMVDFAHRLKQRGYYTATEISYAAGLKARYAQMVAACPEPAAPAAPTASDPVSSELASEIESGELTCEPNKPVS